MRDWNDVLPPQVAARQRRYERTRAAARAKDSGATLKQIAKSLGVSITTANTLVGRGRYSIEQGETPPIDQYTADMDEFLIKINEMRAWKQCLKKRIAADEAKLERWAERYAPSEALYTTVTLRKFSAEDRVRMLEAWV